jgi:hypothetical protein
VDQNVVGDVPDEGEQVVVLGGVHILAINQFFF